MSDYIKGRGGFFLKEEAVVVSVFLGNPDMIGEEAERIMIIHRNHLKDIISTIKMITTQRNG